MRTDVLRRLNDTRQQRFRENGDIDDAILEELRSLVMFRGNIPEYIGMLTSRSDSLDIADDGKIAAFELSSSLRVIGGEIGAMEVTAVVGPNYRFNRNETIQTPDSAHPWLQVENGTLYVRPGSSFAAFKAVIVYVPDPPAVEKVDPSLREVVSLGAASRLAFDRGETILADVLHARREFQMSRVLGIRPETDRAKK